MRIGPFSFCQILAQIKFGTQVVVLKSVAQATTENLNINK